MRKVRQGKTFWELGGNILFDRADIVQGHLDINISSITEITRDEFKSFVAWVEKKDKEGRIWAK